MKKRLLIALLAGGAVFATVFGVAASLNVTSDSLGAGDDQVASCDTDGVTATYITKYVPGPGFVVDAVKLTGVDNACDGQSVTVVLTGTINQQPNQALASEPVQIPTDSNSTDVTVDFDPEPAASAVEDVHVVITG